MAEEHLIPVGKPNEYELVSSDSAKSVGLVALREGMTYEDYAAELEAGRVRAQLGLPPGRAMPTEEEIAAGPVPVRRRVDRLTIIKRLDVLGLLDEAEAAILAAPAITRWRWNIATEGVYADDPETIGFLKSIGANPDVILAP